MTPRARLLACVLAIASACASPPPADLPPDEGGFVESMGQPPTWFPYAGVAAGVWEPAGDAEPSGGVTVGVFRNVLGPIASIGVAGEGYLGARGASLDGGLRGLLLLRPLRFGVGVDYDVAENAPDALLSFLHPLVRGGLFGRGGHLRLDYLPTREHTLQLGVVMPVGEQWIGRTRPKRDHVVLALPEREPERLRAADPALAEALANVRSAVHWIKFFSTPFFDPDAGTREQSNQRFVERVKLFRDHIHERGPLYPEGRSYPEELRVYHAELERAFSLAASGGREGRRIGESTELGRAVSAAARAILLDEVILPYDRLLGRTKKPDTTLGFAASAREAFARWTAGEPRISATARPAVAFVLDEVLDQIEVNRAIARQYWKSSELVWLPVHLGLRPDELETGAQLEALVARAVETEWSRGNEQHYVVNEQFQWELLKHILSAQDYHVLWIHDYRGTDNQKELDELGFDQVYHGYLYALTEAVRRYDETGHLPTFLIFLDQNFYEPNRGRVWMSFLEDPLHAQLELPPGKDHEEKEAMIARAQQALRDAVAGSTRLQAGAVAHGEDWLRNRIKVHVNITNPVDWTFWSQRVIPVLGMPDVLMRDHRKISFYDVGEEDPGRGEAIFTGMGVGEHYAGPTWEDRAMLVRGPALLGLKDAARELLRSQGFRDDQVPWPLRSRPRGPEYAERAAAMAAERPHARGMQLHNETGYAPKRITVAKALLYDAMPAGSILVVPDSLWNSPFWAGMLVGNALRGGRVFAIAPALDNAPSSGFPQMSRGQEIFAQMIVVQQLLGAEMAAVGGALHTGIYAIDIDVGDLAGRTAFYHDHLGGNPLVRTFYDLTPEQWQAQQPEFQARKQRILARLAAMGFAPGYVSADIGDRKPKLHLKAQLFLNEPVLRQLRAIDYREITEVYVEAWARQVRGREEFVDTRELFRANYGNWIEEFRRVQAGLPPEVVEAAGAFLAVGSQNMDYRGMLMDGEVLYLASGGGVLPGLLDLFLLSGTCTWVDDLDELEALLPAYSEWRRQIGRFMKYAL